MKNEENQLSSSDESNQYYTPQKISEKKLEVSEHYDDHQIETNGLSE